jgi:demethylmenaquinone methyltransferase / 2-methoxy-6-polyprenyl-1,4-benzoquinol methylase
MEAEAITNGREPVAPAAERTAAGVRRMFDRVAPRYDLANTVLSLGRDRRWRQAAARAVNLAPGETAADVACGTGRLAAELAREQPSAIVLGLDFSSQMVRRARAGLGGGDRLGFAVGDAMELPLRDASVDVVTIAFGLRNLPDPEEGLHELARVVRPGGRVVCLEITRPEHGALKGFYSLWFDHGIPALGKVFDRRGAYSYLPASVRRFPTPELLGEAFYRAGMARVRYRLLAGGIVALHVGEVVA